jgi:hypothetical protein
MDAAHQRQEQMVPPPLPLRCSTRHFVDSLGGTYAAFEWLGGASWKEVVAHDAVLHRGADRVAEGSGSETPCPTYMVFDVETDGGAGKQLAVQIGYVVYDAAFEEISAHEALLRLPKGRRISWHAQKVHGISNDTLSLHGVDPRPELAAFFEWVVRVRGTDRGRIIAHNAAFDAAVVTNTAMSNGMSHSLCANVCFCTMRRATPRAGLADRRGRPKPPRNSELYELLHDAPPRWAKLHSAVDDCRVTGCNYRAARRRGWWV